MTGSADHYVSRTGGAHITNCTQQLAFQPDLNGSGKKFNYLFADGHIKLLSAEDTIGTGTLEAPKGFWTVAAGD
jgi:prepilin-type processing-associated H-X9-DG protein